MKRRSHHGAPRLHDRRPAVRAGALAADTDELSWRRVWLAGLGRAVGLDTEPGRAERPHRVGAPSSDDLVIDGLEDLFQEFTTNRNQQRALRALLIDCPNGCGHCAADRPDRSSGGHRPGRPPAELRTVRVALSEVRPALDREVFLAAGCAIARCPGRHRGGDRPRPEPSRLLLAAGRQDGIAQSREARSESWFFGRALDFNGQIQARDMSRSPRRPRSPSRPTLAGPILAPAAMRNASAPAVVGR